MVYQSSILLVDDEVRLTQTLSLILKRAGYLVTMAASGAEAMRILQAGCFDLVFLDLKLPDVDGITLLQQIRPMYPDTPVLIMTGHATLTSAIEAVRQGAKDYLLKPADPEQILKRVEEVLADSQHPRRRQEIVGQIRELLGALESDAGGNRDVSEAVPAAGSPGRYLKRGPFVLDMHTRHVQMEERDIALPPTTFDYLVTLVRHSPDLVEYETMVIETQGYHVSRSEAQEIVRWQIHELRKALEPNPKTPRWIITTHGMGYRFVI